MKILPDFAIAGKAFLAPAHKFAAQASADAAIRVLNRLRLILEPECGMKMKRFFKRPDVEGGTLLWRNAMRGRDGTNQERIHSWAGAQAVIPAGQLAERTDAKLREPIADFFRQRTEVSDDHLGFALKPGAQLFVLGGDSHGASVEMALPSHDASDGEVRSGAKTKFVGAENRGKADVAGAFPASVHATRASKTQARADQCGMCFAQT